jgi:hypothetical protein
MEESSARLISIVFAIAVVTSAWLLFEASQQPQRHQTPTHDSNNQPAPQRLPKSENYQEKHAAPSMSSEISTIATTYKCKGPNGTVYRDQVCPSGEKEIEIITSNITPRQPDELATLKEKAAQMESNRMAHSAHDPSKQIRSEMAINNRSICDLIDKQIRQIDIQLREPYQPSWGDYLKGERKKLNDQKFSAGC